MTSDGRATDWGDDRLADAFRARSSALPTPGSLVPATIEHVRAAPRTRAFRFRFAHAGGLAAAAVVIAIVGIGMFGPRPTTDPGDPNAATFGLTPMTVSDAIAIRDTGVDDREIAVEGWYTAATMRSCGRRVSEAPFVNPARTDCPLMWLMERPERLVSTTSTTTTGRFPEGPALNPSLALIDDAGLPRDPSNLSSVTFIGHFDDRRAIACPGDERSSCVDKFVVDRIAVVDGVDVATTTLADPETAPVSTDAAIDARLRALDPGLHVLSRRVTTIERLGATEPTFNGRRGSSSYLRMIVWLVAALPPVDSDGLTRARTYLVPDAGVGPILEITRDGEVAVTESPPPATSPAPQTTIVGDPITVAEAIDHRDNHLDDTELAVRGFGWSPRFPIPCPYAGNQSPAFSFCEDNFTWIADVEPRASDQLIQPSRVALNLLLRSDTAVLANFDGVPRQVIAVGHFDDHRAAQCEEPLIERCRRNFVVDALLDPANPEFDLDANATSRPAGLVAETDDILTATVGRPGGAGRALAIFAVPGAEVAQFEPAAGEVPLIRSASAVWIVRSIENRDDRFAVGTTVVIDGPAESLRTHAWRVTSDGLQLLAVSLDR